jgi:hypothetical protein
MKMMMKIATSHLPEHPGGCLGIPSWDLMVLFRRHSLNNSTVHTCPVTGKEKQGIGFAYQVCQYPFPAAEPEHAGNFPV